MSLLKANAVQLGQSITATNNFVLYQPASPDGTVRLGNGNSGSVTDLVTVGSTGNLTFTGTTETYTNSVTISAASTRTLTLNGGAGSNGLVITASNNVGIGTNSPSSPSAGWPKLLDISGTYAGLVITSTTASKKYSIGVNAAPALVFYDETAGTERMRLDSAGNLGIGTTSPTAAGAGYINLTLNGSTSSFIDLRSNGTGVGRIQADNANSFGIANIAGASGYTHFDTNGSERARIDTSGNLLVGTTSQILAGSKLSISGSGSVGQGPISLVNTSSSTKKWYCGPDSNGSFVVFNDALTGAYLGYGGTTWIANVSDARLKNKIDDIKDAVSAISKLNPLTFYFKNEPNEGIPRYGFFAQNVGDAIPDAMLVSPQEDVELGEVYTYDASIINVYLVKAIQELSAELNELKQRIK